MEGIVFTPLPAVVGGALIGAAASLLLLASGRIAGISGILGAVLRPACPDRAWRLLFLIGLPVGALAVSACTGRGPAPRWRPHARARTRRLARRLRTQLGSGCTSGHGVRGLARASKRSSWRRPHS
jgi:uncharacterized membrane protein YedE/YeeE